MTLRRIALIETGIANIASVRAAFARLGAELVPATDGDAVRHAEHVILPGVGAFAAGIDALRARGLDAALTERIAAGRPTLTICLGLQLLADGSDESPGARGLGVVAGRATRFDSNLRVPQLGWNHVTPDPTGAAWLEAGFAYYANSFRLTSAPAGWDIALSDYGGPFVAAMRRGDVLACQFHPELSGPWGANLLSRWLDGAFPC